MMSLDPTQAISIGTLQDLFPHYSPASELLPVYAAFFLLNVPGGLWALIFSIFLSTLAGWQT